MTHSVTIDGFTQANIAVPYRYPNQVTSAVQDLLIGGGPTGGTFTLTTLAPLPTGTTPPIPSQRHARSRRLRASARH